MQAQKRKKIEIIHEILQKFPYQSCKMLRGDYNVGNSKITSEYKFNQ